MPFKIAVLRAKWGINHSMMILAKSSRKLKINVLFKEKTKQVNEKMQEFPH